MERMHADRIVAINVDIQNDFLSGGSLAVPNGNEIIPVMNAVNAYTREHGGTVVFTGDQHPATTPHFEQWPVHCVAGTEGAKLSPLLTVLPTDIIINKGMGQTDGYSGFEGTTNDGRTLEQIVRPVGKERVIYLIGGLTTENCLRATTLDGLAIDTGEGSVGAVVVEDGTMPINIHPDDGENAIKEMQNAGAVFMKSIDVLTNAAIELAH